MTGNNTKNVLGLKILDYPDLLGKKLRRLGKDNF